MTVGITYNAKVKGFNVNGNVVLETPDGSIAVAQQTGNGVLAIGQPVVLQRSGVPGVSDVCFDPTATPTPAKVWRVDPEPEDKKSNVWILYQYQGKLWVGGHQRIPEPVLDENKLQVTSNLTESEAISFVFSNSIWGDRLGWEVTLYDDLLCKSKLKAKRTANTDSPSTLRHSIGTLKTKETGSISGSALITDYEVSYESYDKPSVSGYGRKIDAFFPGTDSYSLTMPVPWSNIVSEWTGSRGSLRRITSIDRGGWALVVKVDYNTSSLTNSSLYAYATNGSESVDLGLLESFEGGFFGPHDLTLGGTYSAYAKFHWPVMIDLGLPYDLNQNTITNRKYRHNNLQKKYKAKVYDLRLRTGPNLGGTPVAEVSVSIWGIPNEAIVLNTACWLPNSAKYINR